MKTMNLWAGAAMSIAAALLFSSCSKGLYEDGDYPKGEYESAMPDALGGSGYGEENGNGGGGEAGVLTAGEWRDLDHWDFWTSKITGSQSFGEELTRWGFHTVDRIAVRVKDGAGNPVPNVPVSIAQSGKVLWETRTTTAGEANLWPALFSGEWDKEALEIRLDDKVMEGVEVVFSNGQPEQPVNWVELTYNPAKTATANADIAFIVDATGSMGDEIAFLKQDLLSILTSVSQSQSGIVIRTGAVFYRDEGDEYVTRSSGFTDKIDKTMEFVRKQDAYGGGDLPEAVHTALECTLQDLSWNMDARSRIAFLVLDAPAHGDRQKVIDSLQKSITTMAKMGIRIIPVVASTGDKATEFMSRCFAIATNGTYVFLTSDSGVGEEHLEATVGEYQVEKLNALLVRLIEEFI